MQSHSGDMPNTPVRMLRDHMADFPTHALPRGYRFRTYCEGDESVWMQLHVAGEPFVDITPELFRKQFGDGMDVLHERMFFVETEGGAPAASITAWWDKDRFAPDERGRIHWVIVHPEHRRQGIAKAMMTQAMQTLRRHYRWTMLETSTGRPFALNLYLDFGFVPDTQELTDPEILSGWKRVQAQLRHPVLGGILNAVSAPE